jgi:DNA-binding protein HU-beta
MNKADLKRAVAEECGVTQKEAGIVIDSVIDSIKAGVVADGKCTLVGFGTFRTQVAKARKARNPRTGEPIDVPEKTVVKFKPAAAFKEAALEANLPGAAPAAEADAE